MKNHRRGKRKLTAVEQLRLFSWRNKKTGCLLWKRPLTRKGYGHFMVNGVDRQAHHWAYEVVYGPITPGKQVLHTCDVRSCVEPTHLFLGTNADNVADMVAKGRQARGVRLGDYVRRARIKHGTNKLTAAQVVVLRCRRAAGETLAVLARDFGISTSHVWRVAKRIEWRDVA